ncbi:MAG: helix-turn-helix transcriptional regulator [Nitrospirales bacterium]
MDDKKKKKLEAAGFAVGDTQDFLKLSEAEMEYIHIKRSLARTLEQQRKIRNLTQMQAARLLKTSQSRLAKMEHAEKSVSIDLLIRSNLSLGATSKQLKQAL